MFNNVRRTGGAVGLMLLTLVLLQPTAARTVVDLESVYAPYQRLLGKYLVEKDLDGGGLVTAFRYRDAYDDPGTADLLAEQRDALRRFDVTALDEKYEAIAFWLNAYNFFMLAHILENPTDGGSEWIESVRDYGSFFRPYRVFSLDIFEIGGRKYSLDEIEKDILLGHEYRSRGWKEARVHFAVNCASVGCPPLRQVLYTGKNTDALLTENTERALKTGRHMHFDNGTLRLSQLFEWYEEDYREEAGSVRKWIKAFVDEDTRDKVREARRIRHIDYDWTLNAPENFPELR